jgi:hypothetical protein
VTGEIAPEPTATPREAVADLAAPAERAATPGAKAVPSPTVASPESAAQPSPVAVATVPSTAEPTAEPTAAPDPNRELTAAELHALGLQALAEVESYEFYMNLHVGSESAQPHLEDGSVYLQNRPTFSAYLY